MEACLEAVEKSARAEKICAGKKRLVAKTDASEAGKEGLKRGRRVKRSKQGVRSAKTPHTSFPIEILPNYTDSLHLP